MKPTDNGQAYEFIAVYVDDLCVASKNPGKIFQTLKNKYNFKLKGDCHFTIIWGAHTNETQIAP